MTFADAAMRCWSVSVALLGWRPDEFWNATPAELTASLARPAHDVDPLAPELLAELRQRYPD